jgi:hypothetical protein
VRSMLIQDIGSGYAPELVARWLRVPVAVTYSGLSRARLYTLLAEGQIRSASIRAKGRRRGIRLIDRLSIDQFIEKNVTTGTAAK